MSGHSKWSTIKRKKGAADAKRGAIFTRLSKDITLAARDGGGDSDMNPTLRLAIKKAKSSNMPAANIDRAIKKGTGELPGVIYENYIYEGYGPSGVAVLIEVLTDNKNRTFPEIKSIMSKNGGNLGESGCVNWMFEKKGTITISKNNIDEESFLEIIDMDIEDYNQDDLFYEIIIAPEKFGEISKSIESRNIEIDGEVGLIPKNIIKVSEQDATKIVKLLELIEEQEDVQKVHSNFQVE
tara:strand:+ start:30 stop:746 length:717 start_codon:yes stop_codon:yes gene_type:complete